MYLMKFIRKYIDSLEFLAKLPIFNKSNYEQIVEEMHQLLIKLGLQVKAMLKLKLHPQYCIIILSIASRLNLLLSNFCERLNKAKICLINI